MTTIVALAVVLSALMHASWNALVKGGDDGWLTGVLISGFAAGGSLVVAIGFVPWPAAHHWPWLIGSGALHASYFILLMNAYTFGDLGKVYAIARGTAPLIIVALAGGLVGDVPGWQEIAAILVLVAGVVALTFEPGKFATADLKAVILAVLTGSMIAATSNTLTEIGQSGQLEPNLAVTWEASDDAASWRFKIRQDVEFHNGKTMTAEDVVASINHHRGEDTSSAAKPLLESITDIKIDGDTVVFQLSGGDADFPFTIGDYHVTIMPSEEGVMQWREGIGTGGYVLDNFDPGVRADHTRFPNYWREDSAYFDSWEQLSITDVVARTNALTTGEIDVMDRVDLKTLHLLERNTDLKVEETTGTAHYTIPMRTDTAPFDDNNVRMALKLAFDRDEMLRTVLRGHGSVGNDHPISTANRYHATDLPQRAYDPEKAKWHLKQAGLSSLKVDLSAADAALPAPSTPPWSTKSTPPRPTSTST